MRSHARAHGARSALGPRMPMAGLHTRRAQCCFSIPLHACSLLGAAPAFDAAVTPHASRVLWSSCACARMHACMHVACVHVDARVRAQVSARARARAPSCTPLRPHLQAAATHDELEHGGVGGLCAWGCVRSCAVARGTLVHHARIHARAAAPGPALLPWHAHMPAMQRATSCFSSSTVDCAEGTNTEPCRAPATRTHTPAGCCMARGAAGGATMERCTTGESSARTGIP